MKILRVVVGRLQTNCYLLINDKASQAIIVDPGDDADYIIRNISDERLTPTQIIATHGHFDHIMAATELQLAYNIPFLIHKKDEFLVGRLNETACYFIGVEGGLPPKINGHLKQEQKIKLGKLSFEIIETPGHTPGSVCLYNRKEEILIAGDLIFAGGGVGRTDFSYCNAKNLKTSIAKILELPKETAVYSGHGPETTIADERLFHQ